MNMVPSALAESSPHEWISALETMKSGSLSIALEHGPIRLSDIELEDPDFMKLISIENKMQIDMNAPVVDGSSLRIMLLSLNQDVRSLNKDQTEDAHDLEELNREYWRHKHRLIMVIMK